VAGRQNGQAVQLRLRAPTADSQAPPDRTVSFLPGLARPASALTLQIIEPLPDKPVAWVRLHNSLGNQAAVAEWDAAMDQARATHALVLDLRDTPSGGNTTVARSLMGRLVAQPQAYQQHELASEWRRHGVRRVWTEQVWPRGITYRRPVIVLVGPWTGSMGEGTAVGLHAARDAAVVGEPMAGLLGGLGSLTLANSRITVRIPTERLNHVNGTPREHFQPCDASRWPLPAISGSRFERGGADRLVWAAALAAVSVRVPSAHNCS
jgi:carboxyl-terminal processing protease